MNPPYQELIYELLGKSPHQDALKDAISRFDEGGKEGLTLLFQSQDADVTADAMHIFARAGRKAASVLPLAVAHYDHPYDDTRLDLISAVSTMTDKLNEQILASCLKLAASDNFRINSYLALTISLVNKADISSAILLLERPLRQSHEEANRLLNAGTGLNEIITALRGSDRAQLTYAMAVAFMAEKEDWKCIVKSIEYLHPKIADEIKFRHKVRIPKSGGQD